MKALVQRVMQAKVTVNDEVVSSIGRGLCVLIGISRKDTPKEMEYLVRKILNLRVFDDDEGKRWTKSVMDKQFEVLCVSQFTLTSIMKGNKPDFHDAMGPETSQNFYEEFLAQMGKSYDPLKIKNGKFGAYMQVHIQNDGPVTIPLETPASLQDDGKKQNKWNNPNKSSTKKAANKSDSQTQESSSAASETSSSQVTESLTAVSLQDKETEGEATS